MPVEEVCVDGQQLFLETSASSSSGYACVVKQGERAADVGAGSRGGRGLPKKQLGLNTFFHAVPNVFCVGGVRTVPLEPREGGEGALETQT